MKGTSPFISDTSACIEGSAASGESLNLSHSLVVCIHARVSTWVGFVPYLSEPRLFGVSYHDLRQS